MPAQSVWMIRLSLIYLLIISVIGSLLLIHKAVPIHPAVWALLPAHYEMAIWGWVVQLIMGTAYWIFPRYLKGPKRGSEKKAWLVIILFNIGLWTLVMTNLLQGAYGFKIAGRCLIVISIFLFLSIMWNRVVSYRDL